MAATSASEVLLLCAKKFVMCADSNELDDTRAFVIENGAVITRYVYASASCIWII